jgi:hypothetical protein
MGCNDDLRCKSLEPPMSALGHSRPGPAGGRSSNVRYAPKATVGHQNAIGRDVPKADILHRSNNAGLLGQVLPNFRQQFSFDTYFFPLASGKIYWRRSWRLPWRARNFRIGAAPANRSNRRE